MRKAGSSMQGAKQGRLGKGRDFLHAMSMPLPAIPTNQSPSCPAQWRAVQSALNVCHRRRVEGEEKKLGRERWVRGREERRRERRGRSCGGVAEKVLMSQPCHAHTIIHCLKVVGMPLSNPIPNFHLPQMQQVSVVPACQPAHATTLYTHQACPAWHGKTMCPGSR